MDYVKGILCGVAAVFMAEFAYFWPLLRGSKATGMAAFVAGLADSIISPTFWIVGILLFGLFFTASRGSTVLRVLLFWIPTLVVSALGFGFVGLCTYLFIRFRHQ
jgi:hypothetical protein